jgi:hypothetical protein
MNRLNSHFFHSFRTRSRAVSDDGQSALVDKLGVNPNRSRLLIGSHCCHPGIVQHDPGRSAETAVSPHHNNQSTIYNYGKTFHVKFQQLAESLRLCFVNVHYTYAVRLQAIYLLLQI